MSKAVMISIQPKWCELIASGKKTIEVRKTKPKLKTPFKCYIYETRAKDHYAVFHENTIGKVIGEFVCDKITELAPINHSPENVEERACLTRVEIVRYLKGKGYAWHISDLVIYDEPKRISYFCLPCDKQPGCDCNYCKRHSGNKAIIRPPQSWHYVERLRE